MANDLNQCSFIGRVGKIETRFTADGKAITNISLAVNESWKNQQGQKQEKCTWVPVVIFGKLAEIAQKYIEKGQQLFVQGKFQVRKWQDQSGADRYTTEVVLDFNGVMQMLGSSAGTGNSASSQGSSSGYGGAQQPKATNQPPIDDDFDQEVPF